MDDPYKALGLPYHSGLKADVMPLPPGQKARLVFDMTAVSRIVPKGHRLRLTIAGADPRQRNLKEIMQTPPPRISVWHGGGESSRIDLPVSD